MKTKWMVFVLVVCLFLPAWSFGQVLFEGAKVYTVAGPPIENGLVLVDDTGKIVRVEAGPRDPTDPFWSSMPKLKVVDAQNKVLTPGLIDAQTMLGMVEIWAIEGTRDPDPGGGPVRAAFVAADGFHHGAVAIPTTRLGGVTSVVVRPSGGVISGLGAWVDLAGPRFHAETIRRELAMQISTGEVGSRVTGGSRGGVWMLMRELYDDVRLFVANRDAFDSNRLRGLGAGRIHLQALEKTLNRQIPVVVEANRANDILAAIDFADAQGLDLIISGGAEAWLVADALSRSKIPVILDSMRNLPSRFESLGHREDAAAMLDRAGVPVILSTFDSHNVRNLRYFAGNAVREGMNYDAALRAVTLTPAQAFGMADVYGSIEVGKVGNLVLWSGDPFEISSHVQDYYIQGVRVSLYDRQRLLMERYRSLDDQAVPAPKRLPPAEDSEALTPKEHHVE